jgi:hypothetical protein
MTPRFRFEPGKGWYRPDEGFTGWMEPLPFAPRVIACVAVMGELCEPPPTHDNAPHADLICLGEAESIEEWATRMGRAISRSDRDGE